MPGQVRRQELARAAWRAVDRAKARDAEFGRRFRARALSLPAMLQTAGLAATLAFLGAKNEPEVDLLREALGEWIARQLGLGEIDMMEWICAPGTDAGLYRLAGAEARDLAGWLRRAAEAAFPSETDTAAA